MTAADLTREDKFAGFNKKTFDMVIAEARNFALKEILPTRIDGDRIGVRMENGQVKVPESYHRVHQLLLEGEWTSITEAPEHGGQGLPHIVSRAAAEYLVGPKGCDLLPGENQERRIFHRNGSSGQPGQDGFHFERQRGGRGYRRSILQRLMWVPIHKRHLSMTSTADAWA
jgi:hypothetical protein